MVDGALPVALPAANGSMATAPSVTTAPSVAANASIFLRREVYGFLPYWELGSTLDYNTLSTIAYFGVGLNVDLTGTDPSDDGSLYRSGSGWNGWLSSTMTTVINNANAHGTRVALTIESFAWDSAGAAAQTHLLSTPAASLRAAQQIAAEVHSRGAGGVNLDFEPIAPGQSANYVAFVKTLRQQLDLLQPGYELTFSATGRPTTYDLPNLLAPGGADAAFIMGYNLRGGSPAATGSIDPLTSTLISYDLTDAVHAFTSQVPASKVILGLPWYGEAWATGTSTALNAPPGNTTTYGQPVESPYSTASTWAAKDSTTTACQSGWPQPCVLGKFYDTGEQTAWTTYYGNFGGTQNSWREFYFDDARALGARLDAIDGWNLRGAGIWALGYDNNNGDGDLTNTIAAKYEGIPATYVPVNPARVLDTRVGTGLSGTLANHVARTFGVTGNGGVPTNATAVTGNLTVTGQTGPGYLYVGPAPTNNPTSSTLNFPVGDDRANAVTVSLGAGGTLSITLVTPTAGKTANAIFDVTGYFVP
jgi:spore germination protein YaaH